jgi:uncharacterized protein
VNSVPSSTFELIKQALLERKLVSAAYKGHRREMCPHVLGWKGDREHALFFQVGGESSKPLPPEGAWRCVDLDELLEVEVHDGEFRTGSNYYDNPQRCVEKIEAQIPPLKLVAKPNFDGFGLAG